MSDTNFDSMENSDKSKRKSPAVPILVAAAIVVLGVIIWILTSSRKGPAPETAPTVSEPAATSAPESSAVAPAPVETPPEPEAVAPPAPEKVETPPVVAEKPVEPPAPVHPKPKKPKAAPKEPVAKPMAESNASVPATPAPTPLVKKPKAEPVKPVAEPVKEKAPPVEVAMVKPTPAPAVPAEVPPPAKSLTAPKAAEPKSFPAEDLPLPNKTETTEETRQAVAAMPKSEPASEETSAASSNDFKAGMSAYKSQNYKAAIQSFSSVAKPASKKKGSPGRDEYIQANFLRGLSLLKTDNLSQAVTAFQTVIEYEKYYPLANMNLGICYVELKQYAKAHQAFEAVVRDQNFIEPAIFDDVLQTTRYFWALAWMRLYKEATNPDKARFYKHQAILRWNDYQSWYGKNEKYKSYNVKAENYLRSLNTL